MGLLDRQASLQQHLEREAEVVNIEVQSIWRPRKKRHQDQARFNASVTTKSKKADEPDPYKVAVSVYEAYPQRQPKASVRSDAYSQQNSSTPSRKTGMARSNCKDWTGMAARMQISKVRRDENQTLQNRIRKLDFYNASDPRWLNRIVKQISHQSTDKL